MTENSYNTNRLCHNIKMKLQPEIRLSKDKTLSRQTFLVAIGMLTIQETLLQQEQQKYCRDIKTGSRHKFEEAAQKQCRNIIVNFAT